MSMRAFFESVIETDYIRQHLWTTSVHDSKGQYYDFKKPSGAAVIEDPGWDSSDSFRSGSVFFILEG